MNSKPLTGPERARIHEVFAQVPFVQHLGFELAAVERGEATVGASARAEYLQNRGILHGGFTASLIDTATAFAIIGHLADEENTTTVDLTIHYLKPIVVGRVEAKARVVRAGRRIITATAEVTDVQGRLCALATTTYIRIEAVPAAAQRLSRVV
jgi:uncharacterized protein (TIGR00369 family)